MKQNPKFLIRDENDLSRPLIFFSDGEFKWKFAK